ncbi:MAG: hypothetical protein JW947_03260 [Sedimentisphaerales bacterium]|nr:hypothetical protein [Sedimentisphaerales bacterium]
MKKLTILTKKDLVVTLLCIVFLLANIAAVGEGGRKRAKRLVCLSNLFKWGQVYNAYTADNNGYFLTRSGVGSSASYRQMWLYVYKPYYGDAKMRFCPTAENVNIKGGTFGVWNIGLGSWDPYDPALWVTGENAPPFGSYGENRYIVNALGSYANDPAYWRQVGYENAAQVPILMDAQYLAFWGMENASPPEYDGDFSQGSYQSMACINRHNGSINCLFMDFSARRVGLKELWVLKWSRTYNACNSIWTVCGNGGSVAACAARWNAAAPWMRSFPVY